MQKNNVKYVPNKNCDSFDSSITGSNHSELTLSTINILKCTLRCTAAAEACLFFFVNLRENFLVQKKPIRKDNVMAGLDAN